MLHRLIFLLAFLVATSALPTAASPLDDALKVYESGDEAGAIKLLKPLAQQGDAIAQNKLAHIYYWGEGVPRDYVESHRWALMSALQGNAEGEQDVGSHYLLGNGVEKDTTLGVHWFIKAASDGDSYAQLAVGDFYLKGINVARDAALGLTYLQKAADQAEPRAETYLAFVLLSGLPGIERDPVRALHWFTAASEQRVIDAQMVLALMYHDGNGTTKDLVQAAKWALISASGGCARAKALADQLTAELTPEDHQKQHGLVLEWNQTHPSVDRHDHRSYAMTGYCDTGIGYGPGA